MGGEEPPIIPKGTRSVPPRKVSKQWRQTIRWMVCRNAFAGPHAERKLKRGIRKKLSVSAALELDRVGPGAEIGHHLRRTQRSLWKRHFEWILCRGQSRLGQISAGPAAFGLGGFRICSAPQDRKGGQAIHPLDGSPSLFAHLPSGNALRSRCPLRGSAPPPAGSPLPASVGALFVRHWRTAPFEKAGETFNF